jgi:hypothetical protein
MIISRNKKLLIGLLIPLILLISLVLAFVIFISYEYKKYEISKYNSLFHSFNFIKPDNIHNAYLLITRVYEETQKEIENFCAKYLIMDKVEIHNDSRNIFIELNSQDQIKSEYHLNIEECKNKIALSIRNNELKIYEYCDENEKKRRSDEVKKKNEDLQERFKVCMESAFEDFKNRLENSEYKDLLEKSDTYERGPFEEFFPGIGCISVKVFSYKLNCSLNEPERIFVNSQLTNQQINDISLRLALNYFLYVYVKADIGCKMEEIRSASIFSPKMIFESLEDFKNCFKKNKEN